MSGKDGIHNGYIGAVTDIYETAIRCTMVSFSGDAMFHAFERRFGKFEIKVMIPCPVQFRDAKARYSDGLVKVELPKIEERRRTKSVVPVEIA